MADIPPPYPLIVEPVVRRALEEDLGLAGDVTSDAVVPTDAVGLAHIVARKAGRLAGLPVAMTAFRLVDPGIFVRLERHDGMDVLAGTMVAMVEGPARAILSAERTALNFLGQLSGIASATKRVVEAVQQHGTRIACTRKTTPGLRGLEKYAVRVGGGINHRFGLDDGVLIKDNHIVAAGGIVPAVQRCRARLGHMVKIEVEVDTLDQLEQLLPLGVDAVLLDNMPPDTLRKAVERVNGRMITEASGGISLETVRDVAASGVDIISLGWLTHSSPGLDVGLDFEMA